MEKGLVPFAPKVQNLVFRSVTTITVFSILEEQFKHRPWATSKDSGKGIPARMRVKVEWTG